MIRTPAALTRSTAVGVCTLAALAMSFGWGWRGSYGHEAGAMLPGALVGMAVCLASGRADWHRRTVLAGLCGAVGWSWGGALSNMEQTFYVVSDSLPDVVWAFGGVFLVGCLWSGMGSAILSFALTLPRSLLNGFLPPLAANGAALFAAWLVFLVRPDLRDEINAFGEVHLHDTKFLAATIILVTSCVCWLVRPRERSQAGLFVQGALAWWVGYLAFTKFGGILLAPPNRSESWGGFIGVSVVLAMFLARQHNRAGLWVMLVGGLSGGVAFVMALFLTHPLVVHWGPFANSTITDTWKLTEETFGLLMGLGVAAAALALLRGGLMPPEEDADRRGSDGFAAFVLLVPMMWMNLRKNVRDWDDRYDILPDHLVLGLWAWQWLFLVGALLTAFVLYALWRVRRDTLDTLLPRGAFGKGALLFLIVLWTAQCAVAFHCFSDWKAGTEILVEVSYWLLATATTGVLLLVAPREGDVPLASSGRATDDLLWRPGLGYTIAWAAVPVLIVAVALGAMAMQEGPHAKARLRFGPEAYWRLELERRKASDAE